MSLSPQVAAQRGGYGEERYEKEEMQRKVRAAFGEVERIALSRASAGARSLWQTLDAGRTQDEVWEDVRSRVEAAVDAVDGARLDRLQL